MVLVDRGDAPTSDSATEAGRVGGQVGFAVTLTRFMHRLAGNLAGAVKLDLLHVLGRQRSRFVDHIHQNLGAKLGQPGTGHRVLTQDLLSRFSGVHESQRILDVPHAFGTPAHHGLQVSSTP